MSTTMKPRQVVPILGVIHTGQKIAALQLDSISRTNPDVKATRLYAADTDGMVWNLGDPKEILEQQGVLSKC